MFSAESKASLPVEAIYDASLLAHMTRSRVGNGTKLTSWFDRTMSTAENGSTEAEASSMLKKFLWTTTGRTGVRRGNIYRNVAPKAAILKGLP